MKIYFVPGLGASSICFKFINLPAGYEKICIEWFVPQGNETLEEYTYKMAESIDVSEPFILVGYSFGGVIVQEMSKFLNPEKIILIASIKSTEQIPPLFKFIKKIKFTRWFPMGFFSSKGLISFSFIRSVYFKSRRSKVKEQIRMEEYLTQLHPDYMKWSIDAITKWKPTGTYEKIYQIHGTKDPVFPYKYIQKSYNTVNNSYLKTIEGANHILVLEKPKKVNDAFASILLNQ